MSRVLLADDSPHAQRMGERILREEGYDVASVTDGDSALRRLDELDPDVILVDVFLPGKNGFEICRNVKSQDRHQHVRVVMTAGMLEVFDEDEARRSGADAIIKKPFEASVVLDTIKPLCMAAREERISPRAVAAAVPAQALAPTIDVKPVEAAPPAPPPQPEPPPQLEPPPVVVERFPEEPLANLSSALVETPAPQPKPRSSELDPELVRAAVTVVLDESLPQLIDEITSRVVAALKQHQ